MLDDLLIILLMGIFLPMVLIVVIFIGLTGIHFPSLGEGQHYGQISAVDQRGYFFKNYDVYFKTDASSSQEDMYCINRKDVDLVEKAKNAITSKSKVMIQYRGVRGLGWDLCGDAQLTKIEIVN